VLTLEKSRGLGTLLKGGVGGLKALVLVHRGLAVINQENNDSGENAQKQWNDSVTSRRPGRQVCRISIARFRADCYWEKRG